MRILKNSISFANSIRYLCIVFMLYSMFDEFYLGPKLFSTLTWMIIYFILCILWGKIYIGKNANIFLGFIIIILIQMIITSITYQISLIDIIYNNRRYFYLAFYFIISDFVYSNSENYKKLIYIITLFSFIMSFLIVIQGISRSFFTNHWFLNEYAQELSTQWRNGVIRLNFIEGIRVISVIFSFSGLLNKTINKNKILHFLNCFSGFIAFLIFAGTRMNLIILIFTFLLTIWNSIRVKSILRRLVIRLSQATLLVCGVLYFVLYTDGVINRILSSFLVSKSEGSWYARVEAYSYYFHSFISNPIIGIGLITDSISSKAYNIIHGPLGIYYLSDTGIIGVFASIGLLGGVMYLFFVAKICLLALKKHIKGKWTLVDNLACLTIWYLLTLSMLDNGREFMFPIIMLILEIECSNKGSLRIEK